MNNIDEPKKKEEKDHDFVTIPLNRSVAQRLEKDYNAKISLLPDESTSYFRPFLDENRSKFDMIAKWPDLFKFLSAEKWTILEVCRNEGKETSFQLVAVNYEDFPQPYRFSVGRKFGAGGYGQVSAVKPMNSNESATFAMKICSLLEPMDDADDDDFQNGKRLDGNFATVLHRETCQEIITSFYNHMRSYFWLEVFKANKLLECGLELNNVLYMALMNKNDLECLVDDAVCLDEFLKNGHHKPFFKMLENTRSFIFEMVTNYKSFTEHIHRVVNDQIEKLNVIISSNKRSQYQFKSIFKFFDQNFHWNDEEFMSMIPIDYFEQQKLLNLPRAVWISISMDEVNLHILGRPFHETYKEYLSRISKCDSVVSEEFRIGASTIMMMLARGLSDLHDVGCIHRDLTPENILGISHRDGEQKSWFINDFSLTRSLIPAFLSNSGPENCTEEYCNKLTLGGNIQKRFYSAPELTSNGGSNSYDEKIDIFSLGMIFYETLATYFFENQGNDRTLKMGYAWKNGTVDKTVSGKFKDETVLIESMINTNPHERPSAEECYENLHSLVYGAYHSSKFEYKQTQGDQFVETLQRQLEQNIGSTISKNGIAYLEGVSLSERNVENCCVTDKVTIGTLLISPAAFCNYNKESKTTASSNDFRTDKLRQSIYFQKHSGAFL